MLNRLVFVLALAIAVQLLARVYETAETLIGLFPLDKDLILFFDLEFGPLATAVFIAAHACVAWFVVRIRRGAAPLSLKVLTLILLGEVVAIYLMTLRFWYGGVDMNLY